MRQRHLSYEEATSEWRADPEWQREVLDLVEAWSKETGNGWDVIAADGTAKRLERLEDFIGRRFPEASPRPFDSADAAALILAPRRAAEWLARQLFGSVDSADVRTFNLDWVLPPDRSLFPGRFRR